MENRQTARARSTEIRCIKLSAVEQADELARQYDLPFLAEFLSDMSARLTPASEAGGRRYQQEIIERGELEVISPYTGKPATSAHSFLVIRSIFYRFPGRPKFYLAAARTVLGQPLIALFAPRENLLLKWELLDNRPSVEKRHVVKLKSILSRPTLRATPSGEPVAVLVGHRNFAHHLWNELPALERLLTVVRPQNTPELLIRREPLGPLTSIYPELSQWKITRIDWGMSPSINDAGRLFVKPGSYRMPSAVRTRIRRFAEHAATAPTVNLISMLQRFSAPTFWISVRTQKPTITNQVATLATLAARLFTEFKRCAILFDGFSAPDDWLRCDQDMRAFYSSSVESSKKEINTIIDKVREISPPTSEQLIVNAGGFGILDSIALAQTAHCYLCHVGTVQHKIGWTTDKGGIVHANRKRIIEKNSVWHHPDWLEDGVLPIPIPYNVVEASENEDNYTVLDPDEFAEFVVCRFRCYVSKTLESLG